MKNSKLGYACILFGIIFCSVGCSDKVNETNEFKDVLLNSATFNFDGQEHCLVLEGNIPEGTEVIWENNSRTLPGVSNVSVSLSKENYFPLTLSANLIVNSLEFSNDVALVPKQITNINPGDEYSFTIENSQKLPSNYTVDILFINKISGERYNEKPYFGGEFLVEYELNAPGYNSKILEAELQINYSEVESVEFTNIPSIDHPRFENKNIMLKNQIWKPDYIISPLGADPTNEIVLSSLDNSIIKVENNSFVAVSSGITEISITVSGKTDSISIEVLNEGCFYENFEGEHHNGVASEGTVGKLIDDPSGNHSYYVYKPVTNIAAYSFLEVKVDLDSDFKAGSYHFECDVISNDNSKLYFQFTKTYKNRGTTVCNNCGNISSGIYESCSVCGSNNLNIIKDNQVLLPSTKNIFEGTEGNTACIVKNNRISVNFTTLMESGDFMDDISEVEYYSIRLAESCIYGYNLVIDNVSLIYLS